MKEKRVTAGGLDFSSCTFHFHNYKMTAQEKFGLRLLFIIFICFNLPGQTRSPRIISIFVIIYLLQGHQGNFHLHTTRKTFSTSHPNLNHQPVYTTCYNPQPKYLSVESSCSITHYEPCLRGPLESSDVVSGARAEAAVSTVILMFKL